MTSLARTVEGKLFLHPFFRRFGSLIFHSGSTRSEFATSAIKAIAKNPYDIPFAILYHVEEVVRKPTTREVRAGKTTSERKTVKLSCKVSCLCF